MWPQCKIFILGFKIRPLISKNYTNMFYEPRGTHQTLHFCSGTIRSQVISEKGIWSLLSVWPDLRGHRLTQDLKFIHNRFVSWRTTRSFFFREALAQSGAKLQGGFIPWTPTCAVEGCETVPLTQFRANMRRIWFYYSKAGAFATSIEKIRGVFWGIFFICLYKVKYVCFAISFFSSKLCC